MNFQNLFSDSESARQAESESRRKKRKKEQRNRFKTGHVIFYRIRWRHHWER